VACTRRGTEIKNSNKIVIGRVQVTRHVKCKYTLHHDKWLTAADNDSDKRQTRPLVREGTPQ
jgi:hypothetical protein